MFATHNRRLGGLMPVVLLT
uniref:Uncharacterized protein n=1 Tax=Anguilla anguilla TaxID=7936 RepID=A0A0E9T1A3_ANGAN